MNITSHMIIDIDSLSWETLQKILLKYEGVETFDVQSIEIIGSSPVTINNYMNKVRKIFPNKDVFAWEFDKNSTTAFGIFAFKKAVWTTNIVDHGLNGKLFLITKNPRVVKIGKMIEDMGIEVHIYEENYDSKAIQKAKATSQPNPLIPQWYKSSACRISKVGFRVIQDVTVNGQSLLFIPFFLKDFSIGSGGDVSLNYWNSILNLYDKSVELKYNALPQATFSIRSLKGHRTGKRSVTVNDKLIDSSSQKVYLKQGDIVSICGLKVEYQTDLQEILSKFEHPYNIIEQIENRLKFIATKFSKDECPQDIISDITNENGELDWRKAYFKSYSYLIVHNWHSEKLHSLTSAFLTPSTFIKEINVVNRIRNKVMHPSKGKVSQEEMRELVAFYIKFSKQL